MKILFSFNAEHGMRNIFKLVKIKLLLVQFCVIDDYLRFKITYPAEKVQKYICIFSYESYLEMFDLDYLLSNLMRVALNVKI